MGPREGCVGCGSHLRQLQYHSLLLSQGSLQTGLFLITVLSVGGEERGSEEGVRR